MNSNERLDKNKNITNNTKNNTKNNIIDWSPESISAFTNLLSSHISKKIKNRHLFLYF